MNEQSVDSPVGDTGQDVTINETGDRGGIKRMSFSPFQQGDMDGLCGLYSLINSARLADPTLHMQTCRAMFRDSLRWLGHQGYLPGVFYGGLTINMLLSLQKQVLRKRRPLLKIRRPFIQSRPTTDEEFWAILESISNKAGQACLVGVATRTWSHWTIVKSITSRQLFLFDSGGFSWFWKKNCTSLKDREHRYVINPASVLVVSVSSYLPE